MMPGQEAIALIVINLAGRGGDRLQLPEVLNRRTKSNPARIDGHQCGAQRDTQNENWQTSIAEE
jgi:hypothetical protein